jgi:hypothetical protein
MHNHYYAVLFVDKTSADSWADLEVIKRWHRLFNGNAYSQRYVQGESLSPVEQQVLDRSVELWRARLTDIS